MERTSVGIGKRHEFVEAAAMLAVFLSVNCQNSSFSSPIAAKNDPSQRPARDTTKPAGGKDDPLIEESAVDPASIAGVNLIAECDEPTINESKAQIGCSVRGLNSEEQVSAVEWEYESDHDVSNASIAIDEYPEDSRFDVVYRLSATTPEELEVLLGGFRVLILFGDRTIFAEMNGEDDISSTDTSTRTSRHTRTATATATGTGTMTGTGTQLSMDHLLGGWQLTQFSCPNGTLSAEASQGNSFLASGDEEVSVSVEGPGVDSTMVVAFAIPFFTPCRMTHKFKLSPRSGSELNLLTTQDPVSDCEPSLQALHILEPKNFSAIVTYTKTGDSIRLSGNLPIRLKGTPCSNGPLLHDLVVGQAL